MAKKPVIIYDYLNKLVWVDGQPGTKEKTKGGKPTTKYHYGKDAKRFKSNVQARSYALTLGKRYEGRVYDRSAGKYLKFKSKKKTTLKSNLKQVYKGEKKFAKKTKKKFKRLNKKYPRQTLQKDMGGMLGW